MINYEDRGEYYKEYSLLNEFYRESPLWEKLVKRIIESNLLNFVSWEVYGHSIIDILNEARFLCINICSDEKVSSSYIKKTASAIESRLGKDGMYMCYSIVYFLLYYSLPKNSPYKNRVRAEIKDTIGDKCSQYALFDNLIGIYSRKENSIDFRLPMQNAAHIISSPMERKEVAEAKDWVDKAIIKLIKRVVEEKDKEIEKINQLSDKELRKHMLEKMTLHNDVKEKDAQIKKHISKQVALDKRIVELEEELQAARREIVELRCFKELKDDLSLLSCETVSAKDAHVEYDNACFEKGRIQGAEEERKRIDSSYLPLESFVEEANACDQVSEIEAVQFLITQLLSSNIFRGPQLEALSNTADRLKKIWRAKQKTNREEEIAAKGGVTVTGGNNGLAANNIGLNLSSKGVEELIRRLIDNRK